jgi:hypothetical protein
MNFADKIVLQKGVIEGFDYICVLFRRSMIERYKSDISVEDDLFLTVLEPGNHNNVIIG